LRASDFIQATDAVINARVTKIRGFIGKGSSVAFDAQGANRYGRRVTYTGIIHQDLIIWTRWLSHTAITIIYGSWWTTNTKPIYVIKS